MKNFLDLQDINTVKLITIRLSSIINNGIPTAVVKINNNTIFNKNLEHTVDLNYSHDLMTPFLVSIEMQNKQYNQYQETAIIIESILIDNNELIPEYNHLVDYQNDHSSNNPTNYLGFNGKWTLTIDRPFYQWLHQAQGQGWLLS
jgi:hypothetical protein